MSNVGGAGNNNQIQALDFSVSPDPVNKEEGFLNGSKVTVEAIPKEKFSGVRFGKDKFEPIPVASRPVKVWFKDLKKKIENSSFVQKVEHQVAGRLKRWVKQENVAKISQGEANDLLAGLKDPEDQKVMAGMIQKLNTKVATLDQRKDDYIQFKHDNDMFKETYKTAFNIIDGKQSASKGLVIALPPEQEDGEIQYMQLNSDSKRDRAKAMKELGAIFERSPAYEAYTANKTKYYKIRKDRSPLKKDIKSLRQQIQLLSKQSIKDRVVDQKSAVNKKVAEEIAKERKDIVTAVQNETGRISKDLEELIDVVYKDGGLKEQVRDLGQDIMGRNTDLDSKRGEVARLDGYISRLQNSIELANDDEKSKLEEILHDRQEARVSINQDITALEEELIAQEQVRSELQGQVDAKLKEIGEKEFEMKRKVNQAGLDKAELVKRKEKDLVQKKKQLEKDGKNDIKAFQQATSGRNADKRARQKTDEPGSTWYADNTGSRAEPDEGIADL